MTTKMIEAVRRVLGRTPLGREVLDAAGVEEERLEERKTATQELTEAADAERNLGALADKVEADAATFRAEMERLGSGLQVHFHRRQRGLHPR